MTAGRSPLRWPREGVKTLPKTGVGVTVLALVSLLACKDLPVIATNVCGNGVVEAGEDCDGYSRDEEFCLPPGHANECRYSCATQIRQTTGKPFLPQCPEEPKAMSCGPDLGICRTGTERYSPWGEFVAVEARALESGDLDGDGRYDLLALGNSRTCWDSSAQVLFFDTNGHATPAFDAFTPLNSPTMASLTVDDAGSQRQQIVGGTLYGLATLVANQPGQISSVPYPFLTRPLGASYRMIRLRGVSHQLLGEQILFRHSNGNVTAAESDKVLSVIPPELGTLAGDPVAANVVEGAQSECDELVFSIVGAAQIYSLSVCGPDNALRASTEPPHVIATLPEGHTAATTPILADIDGDKHLDLVVGDQNGHAFLSFGTGEGTFSGNQASLTADGQFWKVMLTRPKQGQETPSDAPMPLAIGQLDDKGPSDWVMSDGILQMSQVTPDPVNRAIIGSAVRTNDFVGRSWNFATVADLNRDGYPDVLAGLKDGSSLDYLKGTGQAVLTGQTIVTSGKIKEVIVGDYDGNQVNDVALIQQYDEDTGSPQEATSLQGPFSLAIGFSKRDEGPTSMVEVARFPSFSQIISGNYQVTDYIEEIGVLSQAKSEGPLQLILFLGNRTQRPIASLGLWRKSDGTFAVPFSTAVVKREKPGILSVTEDECDANQCPFSLWYVPGTGSVALEQTVYLGPIPENALIQQTQGPDLTARLIVGVLDQRQENTIEDALLLTASRDEQSILLWRVAIPTSVDPDAQPGEPLAPLSSIAGRLSSETSPKLVDLDRDGWGDLALLFDALDGSQRFLVLWSDGGSFDFANSTSIPVGPARINDLVLNGPLRKEHLYAVRKDAILEIKANPSRRRELEQAAAFPAASDGTPVTGGRTIAIGDFTRDGLPDLAVAVTGGVRLYKQEAEAP